MTQEAFKAWWYNEGSQAPYTHHDCEEHTMRMCEIAWNAAVRAEQEPVAWINEHGHIDRGLDAILDPTGWTPLYTSPQQRTWVGLTFAEICECENDYLHKFARAIEAKLKEKNNG